MGVGSHSLGKAAARQAVVPQARVHAHTDTVPAGTVPAAGSSADTRAAGMRPLPEDSSAGSGDTTLGEEAPSKLKGQDFPAEKKG